MEFQSETETVKNCPICDAHFFKTIKKTDYRTVQKIISSIHVHYGTPIYNYGVCTNHHLTKLNMDKINWPFCYKCSS